MRILHVVGARPNYPKVAPVLAEMSRYPDVFQQVLVHTGQHYDDNMSKIFFEDLDMPAPDEFLNVGPGTHAEQTARVMVAFEPVLVKYRPDWVLVVGDVNSTLACALVAVKLGVPVAHVEAGLRSRDRTMPEEINRLLTDQIAGLLFTPSRDANGNLLQEGVAAEKIHFVGNIMIDTLVKMLPKALSRPVLAGLGLQEGQYVLVTLHRPSNVDDPHTLREILAALEEIGARWPVIFPVHPRTRQRIEDLHISGPGAGVSLLEPLGYLDFLALTHSAGLVITDSGGIQEETTFLGVPCLTARANTERPVTIQAGTNRLVASTQEAICSAFEEITLGRRQNVHPPEYWDGLTAQRIVKVFLM